MRVLLLLAVLVPWLGGCVSTPGDQAGFRRLSAREYQAVAACAYDALDRRYPTKIRMVDLKAADMVRISLEETTTGLISSATSRAFDMTIRKADKGSAIEIASAPTVLGANHYGERTWREISACV